MTAAFVACRHLGQEELLKDIRAEFVVDTSALGDPEKAAQLLATLKIDPSDSFHLSVLEYAGQGNKVEPLLKEQLATHPRCGLSRHTTLSTPKRWTLCRGQPQDKGGEA